MSRTLASRLLKVLVLGLCLVTLPGCGGEEGTQPVTNEDGTINPDGLQDLVRDQNTIDVLIDCGLDGNREEDCDQREQNAPFWAKVLQHGNEEAIEPLMDPVTEPIEQAEKGFLCLTVGWFCPATLPFVPEPAQEPEASSFVPTEMTVLGL